MRDFLIGLALGLLLATVSTVRSADLTPLGDLYRALQPLYNDLWNEDRSLEISADEGIIKVNHLKLKVYGGTEAEIRERIPAEPGVAPLFLWTPGGALSLGLLLPDGDLRTKPFLTYGAADKVDGELYLGTIQDGQVYLLPGALF
jgi:uncharacterized protein Usg